MGLMVYSDGGARGNPGPAAIGVVICDEAGEILDRHKDCIGTATNNMAEYLALIAAYEIVQLRGVTDVAFHLDSELVVKQMRGEYKVKDAKMKQLHAVIKQEESKLVSVSYTHLRREHPYMQKADRLVNDALDGL